MADDEDLLFMQIAQQKAKATKKKAAQAPLPTDVDVTHIDEEDDLPESESGAARTEVHKSNSGKCLHTNVNVLKSLAIRQRKQKAETQQSTSAESHSWQPE